MNASERKKKMRKNLRNKSKEWNKLTAGIALTAAFVVWTLLIKNIDVKAVGSGESYVGFAAVNVWFHNLTGVYWNLYTITDWLGLVPLFVCIAFGILGLIQLIKRRNMFKVDTDILILGIYYIVVILAYLIFEMVPINYRPMLIDGHLEASYPSSTTLLVLSVMPTLKYQIDRRVKSVRVIKANTVFVIVFSVFVVIGRLISGVHWLTDIIGALFLSIGLFLIYEGAVEKIESDRKSFRQEES